MERFRQLLLTSSVQMNQIYIRKKIVNVTIRLYKKGKRKEKRKKKVYISDNKILLSDIYIFFFSFLLSLTFLV